MKDKQSLSTTLAQPQGLIALRTGEHPPYIHATRERFQHPRNERDQKEQDPRLPQLAVLLDP